MVAFDQQVPRWIVLALALGLFAFHFPRRDRWEEWAGQTPPRA